jgi:hypothetical protein
MDYILPKDTLRRAGPITLICGLVGSGIILLMAFVNPCFTLGLALPGIIQIAMFRDVRVSGDGFPLIGLPLWVATATATPVVLFSVAGYFSQHRFIYLGVCFVIGIPWVFQGYRMAKKPGPLVPDTVETEALAWYLQQKLSSPFCEFRRAALHADTSQRKIILSNSLFPVIASRMESYNGDPISQSDLISLVDCINSLSDFKLQNASILENTAAVKYPKNWERLLDLLNGIPERKEDTLGLRNKLVREPRDQRKQNSTSTPGQASAEVEITELV